MGKRSRFIVIEGLDGSGKTSVGRQLVKVLNAHFTNKVKFTYEPHDPSCAGEYIREVLTKKIKEFTPRTLALSFAANRLDHCDREINPWLNDDDHPKLIICDRYYLSSLVYQSEEDFPFDSVLQLNELARKPDVIFFLNVSIEVCQARMKNRNQPEELFEVNFTKTRNKYLAAIDFLKTHHGDNIIFVDASGTIEEVVASLLEHISDLFPDWGLRSSASERPDNNL